MSAHLFVWLREGHEPAQLVLVVSLVLACAACLAWIAASALKHAAWYSAVPKKGASRTGLNAAEKGTSSVAVRAERIPYDLEKRAILHRVSNSGKGRGRTENEDGKTDIDTVPQRWTMIGHESQFPGPGDYRTHTVADLPLLVIRGPDGALRAFHNVCRHRAYPVARKPSGSSPRLACKYHGWQYDAAGQLVKAPQFADKPGFDAAAHGLFRIHLRTDAGRFVFVNLAAELADAFPWADVSSPALRALDFGRGVVEWQVELDVGWRVATLLPWFLNGTRFLNHAWPKKALAYLCPTARPRLQYVDDASFICPLGAGDHLLVSALPRTAHQSVAKCTYLPSPAVSPDPGDGPIAQLERRVRDALALAVAALQRHRMPTTALGFRQSAVRERLDKFARHVHQHRRAEALAGRKINPALRRPAATAATAWSSPPPPSSASAGAGSRPDATTGRDDSPIGWGEVVSGEAGAAPGSSQQQHQQQPPRIQPLLSAADGAPIDLDAEAEAICNALDGLGDDGATTSACPWMERSPELEW